MRQTACVRISAQRALKHSHWSPDCIADDNQEEDNTNDDQLICIKFSEAQRKAIRFGRNHTTAQSPGSC